MKKNRLYLLLLLGLSGGYAYIAYVLLNPDLKGTACFFKNLTGVPCPSCGNTRAITALAKGHVAEAAFTNPLGILMGVLMLALPFWLLYDVACKKETLYKSYISAEATVRKKPVAVTAVTLILLNWIWNIAKGL